MEVLFIYILPIVVVVLECFFIRSCIVYKPDDYDFRRQDRGLKRMPRSVYFFAILSLIPIVGLIVSVSLIIWVMVYIQCGDYELSDNKFTRYWFKS